MSISRKMAAFMVCTAISAAAIAAEYPSAGNGTAPNVWTRNYSGVLSAAQTTGYPIFLIMVNSSGCSHCSTMMANTVNTADFEKMDKEFTFYKVIMDMPYSSGTSAWRACYNRYRAYLNNGMFPAVVVARRDGSAYGGFGNKTTDKRGVVADIRAMMEALAKEQGADIRDGGSGVPDDPTPTPTPSGDSAAKWASRLKGKATGVVFDADQDLIGSCVVKTSAKGGVSVKFTGASAKATVKGSLAVSDGKPVVKSGNLDLVYDANARMWLGKWGDRSVFAALSADSGYDGVYTMGAEDAGGRAGYFSLTVKRGKGKVSGMVNGKNKVSTNGDVVAIPASLIAERLGEWDTGEDLLFVPMVKRGGVTGGVVLSKGGAVAGTVAALGAEWDVAGWKWSSSTSLKALDGTVFTVSGRDIEIPLAAPGGSQLAFGANEYAAKIKVAVRTGLFKGSLKKGKEKVSFAGVLVGSGKSLVGRGVTTGKGAANAVAIGSPCGGDCAEAELR